MVYADFGDGRRAGLWQFGLRSGLPTTRLDWSGFARWPGRSRRGPLCVGVAARCSCSPAAAARCTAFLIGRTYLRKARLTYVAVTPVRWIGRAGTQSLWMATLTTGPTLALIFMR